MSVTNPVCAACVLFFALVTQTYGGDNQPWVVIMTYKRTASVQRLVSQLIEITPRHALSLCLTVSYNEHDDDHLKELVAMTEATDIVSHFSTVVVTPSLNLEVGSRSNNNTAFGNKKNSVKNMLRGLQYAYEAGSPWMIMLEDDVDLSPDIMDYFRASMAWAEANVPTDVAFVSTAYRLSRPALLVGNLGDAAAHSQSVRSFIQPSITHLNCSRSHLTQQTFT